MLGTVLNFNRRAALPDHRARSKHKRTARTELTGGRCSAACLASESSDVVGLASPVIPSTAFARPARNGPTSRAVRLCFRPVPRARCGRTVVDSVQSAVSSRRGRAGVGMEPGLVGSPALPVEQRRLFGFVHGVSDPPSQRINGSAEQHHASQQPEQKPSLRAFRLRPTLLSSR